jgi:cell fate (sporulation/competence/biofilm development) regulator YlbF (YheA/YmcA/DUF963 family)
MGDEAILQLATRLGEAIKADPRAAALKAAADGLEQDESARTLQEEYAEVAQALQDKAAKGEPLEPEDKRRELDLRQQVASRDSIRAFLRAQADFSELMSSVNGALEEAIGVSGK